MENNFLNKFTPTLNTDKYEIMQIANILGINENDFKLLMEAYRRKNNPLIKCNKVYGFGIPSKYKSHFFKPINKDNVKRHYNSEYTLTNKGKEVLNIIENFIYVPKDIKIKEHFNKVLLKF